MKLTLKENGELVIDGEGANVTNIHDNEGNYWIKAEGIDPELITVTNFVFIGELEQPKIKKSFWSNIYFIVFVMLLAQACLIEILKYSK